MLLSRRQWLLQQASYYHRHVSCDSYRAVCSVSIHVWASWYLGGHRTHQIHDRWSPCDIASRSWRVIVAMAFCVSTFQITDTSINTLQCAQQIYDSSTTYVYGPPGSSYNYDSVHMLIASLMVQYATKNETWQNNFGERCGNEILVKKI